ncbi:Repressor ROX1 OS=Saccharomyces cerevisiae (strain ATCC 204508 / S288c) GN=ROX1 PE=1 SV=1 [Rhizoctonia solani AG-1 IB]|uniref:RFG1 protein n=1 Tax=Thanatephorus cucumeris (strain AG1-IB / isolate 7/3/14) TaxID=1108050 RepID=M5BNF0_THACB|nr:Repressor ROX1 AltName: Full=Heme-dependent repression factor [Rhizoctonia solani AG-1 IB]CEL58257.1 Repressor ROX1 OS=Saccharomyces cerevisiae (strain ATCC 204508 / S288c) GN=ROX1 PE=1 SV=1 [Rhizoctonia solani AG-1 IB]
MFKSSSPSRSSRSLDPVHDTSGLHSTPQHTSNDHYNALRHTDFDGDTLRFTTERGAPYRPCHPRDDKPSALKGSVSRARVPLELDSRPASPHEHFEPVQAATVGPMRVDKNHNRRQPPGHIPRPRNAFILYRSWYVKQGFLSGIENDHREISRIVGRIWRQMSAEEQDPWKTMAEEEKTEHARMYPGYKYSPNSRRDAAAVLPTSRDTAFRSSSVRSRKARVSETPTKKRSDAIVGAFVSRSRKLSLSLGVRKVEQEIKAEGSDMRSCSPSYPTSPSGQPIVAPERPSSPAHPRAPSVSQASISDDRTGGSNTLGTSPGVSYEPTCDFSLAACSTFPAELSPNSVQLLSPDEYYRCESFLKAALKQDYDSDVTLGTGMTCDDASDFSLVEFSTDSNLYSQTSYTSATHDHYPMVSEPEISPFGRILHEGTWAGHPEAVAYDTPTWDTLLSSSSTSTKTNSSVPSESFSNFSWDESRAYPTGEEEYSTSSVSGGEVQSSDCGLFSEWCNPDSVIATDVSGTSMLTLMSLPSGAPLPLSGIHPSQMHPQKSSALTCHSWEVGYDDMDAYECALGDIETELDDHRFF